MIDVHGKMSEILFPKMLTLIVWVHSFIHPNKIYSAPTMCEEAHWVLGTPRKMQEKIPGMVGDFYIFK